MIIFAISFYIWRRYKDNGEDTHDSIRLFRKLQHPYVARNHVVYRRYEGAPRKTSALRGDEAGRAGKPRRGRENTEHERVKQKSRISRPRTKGFATLMAEKAEPKNRDEREIAGYRFVLDTIHERHDAVP